MLLCVTDTMLLRVTVTMLLRVAGTMLLRVTVTMLLRVTGTMLLSVTGTMLLSVTCRTDTRLTVQLTPHRKHIVSVTLNNHVTLFMKFCFQDWLETQALCGQNTALNVKT
jgi:hypothetical protein